MTSTADRKAGLMARRDHLRARLGQIEAELDSPSSRDWEELATEREGDEVLEDLGQSAQSELRMIEAALHRIEEGTYGTCAKCGGDIDAARLDLVPATPFCRTCAV